MYEYGGMADVLLDVSLNLYRHKKLHGIAVVPPARRLSKSRARDVYIRSSCSMFSTSGDSKERFLSSSALSLVTSIGLTARSGRRNRCKACMLTDAKRCRIGKASGSHSASALSECGQNDQVSRRFGTFNNRDAGKHGRFVG